MGEFALPVDEDDITILGIMASLEIAAANEFSQYLDSRFKAEGEMNWFENIQHYRRSINSPFNYLAPNDLRFVLGEATLPDSQIWHLIPNINQMWVNSADGLRKKLNQLHHQQLKPDLNTLYQIASLFDAVTSGPGLAVSNWARALKGRVQDIRSGQFQKPAVQIVHPPVPEEIAVIEKEYEEVKRAFEKRPPWGAKWTGPKPTRRLTLDRHTRDIYDSNGSSVKGELGQIGDHVIGLWLRYFPLGGEVWVDSDGATMGYLKGIATMVGWFGPGPDEHTETVRGFVLPKEFEFTGTDILDIEAGNLLTENSEESVVALMKQFSESLPQGTRLNITDYGDVFVPVLEGEPKRVRRMHKGVWFPGQLPG